MKVRMFTIALLCSALFVSCQTDNGNIDTPLEADGHTLHISIAESRTSLGNKSNGIYPVYWSNGDCIVVNGQKSHEAEIYPENRSVASFYIDDVLSTPYHITYPYCTTTTAETPKVVFLAEQSYIEGTSAAKSLPMCGYKEDGYTDAITLQHLAGILRLPIVADKDSVELEKIVITCSDTKLAGEFTVDCKTATLAETENTSNVVTYSLPSNFALSTSKESVFHISLPAVTIGTCTIEFFDCSGDKMVANWSNKEIKAGIVREFKTITYSPNTTVSLEGFGVDYDFFEDNLIYGYVRDTNNNPLSGVVVSNGRECVKTDDTGLYYIHCDLSGLKFVMVSIPSGYKAPNDENGLPCFFHRITEKEIMNNNCYANFTLEPISGDPNKYTLFVGADPQPRSKGSTYDKIGFHSLDICEDFYRDLRETKATITDQEVYGLMLGDLVHENATLYSNYVAGLSTLGFQMFNVIGNHDHDYKVATDREGSHVFEENFGPTYYSFNLGKQHYIVLDNCYFPTDTTTGLLSKSGYNYSLTDEQWEWLQNDLKFIDKSTTIMVATHAPMFRRYYDGASSGAHTKSATKHGKDYANLFASYDKVHAWAGHAHNTYNYVYPESSSLHGIEVHTVARSTGQFWTNDYNASGTPRGYTVVEVNGDEIQWRFKPTIYQSEFSANNYSYTTGMPEYLYRDWDYDSNGIAKMRSTGKTLNETYQMKVYKPGEYAEGMVFVNIFLWDDKWEVPKFNGKTMQRVYKNQGNYTAYFYDLAFSELFDFYKANNTTLAASDDFKSIFTTTNFEFTLFCIDGVTDASGQGTVTVTDRFGNNYSSTISW